MITISTSGSHRVTWTNVSDVVGQEDLGYELQMWTSRNDWITILAGSFTEFDAVENESGTWCYRVRTNSQLGSSSWSDIACASVMPPDPLTTIRFEPHNEQVNISVELSAEGIPQLRWQANTQSGYHIWRSLDDRGEAAVRITVAEMGSAERFMFDDISYLDLNSSVVSGSAQEYVYWLVESRDGASFLHGPFAITESTSVQLYMPISNR